jgi:hypothetical protein
MMPRVYAFCLVFAVGCGGSNTFVPVSGVVKLDGKPLSNAHIVFQPESSGGPSAEGSFAFTDASGAYKLRTMTSDQTGAVVGKHRVEINLVVESDDRDPKTRPQAKVLPAKYNRNTELSFDVPKAGTDQANFELKER